MAQLWEQVFLAYTFTADVSMSKKPNPCWLQGWMGKNENGLCFVFVLYVSGCSLSGWFLKEHWRFTGDQ